jgi:hypothetical protein
MIKVEEFEELYDLSLKYQHKAFKWMNRSQRWPVLKVTCCALAMGYTQMGHNAVNRLEEIKKQVENHDNTQSK